MGAAGSSSLKLKTCKACELHLEKQDVGYHKTYEYLKENPCFYCGGLYFFSKKGSSYKSPKQGSRNCSSRRIRAAKSPRRSGTKRKAKAAPSPKRAAKSPRSGANWNS